MNATHSPLTYNAPNSNAGVGLPDDDWWDRCDDRDFPYRLACRELFNLVYENMEPAYVESFQKGLPFNTLIRLANILETKRIVNVYSRCPEFIVIGPDFGQMQIFLELYFDVRCIGIYKDQNEYSAAIKAHSNLYKVVCITY